MLLQIPAIVIFSLFIAVLLNKEMPGRAFFRLVLFIPVILSVGYFETVMSGDVMTANLSEMNTFDSGVSGSTGFFTAERLSEYLIQLNISPSGQQRSGSAAEQHIHDYPAIRRTDRDFPGGAAGHFTIGV